MNNDVHNSHAALRTYIETMKMVYASHTMLRTYRETMHNGLNNSHTIFITYRETMNNSLTLLRTHRDTISTMAYKTVMPY